MLVCSNCGEENPAKFRMCGFCGTPLVAAAPAQETCKLVSILFCDLKGSTSLGENLDPESLREVMARYFEVMSAAIVRHGGTVEKYIGDAVMAYSVCRRCMRTTRFARSAPPRRCSSN
jgi:class 3 adenylate cyclase